MNKKISIIIITLDRANLLKKCLKSLAKQAKMPDEVIVVDSSLTDDTKKVVKKFKPVFPDLKYIFEPKQGVSVARNTGLRNAHEDLIAFVDDDCIVDKNWIKNLIEFLNNHPEADVIYSKITKINSRNLFIEASQLFYKITMKKFFFFNPKKGFITNFLTNMSSKEEITSKQICFIPMVMAVFKRKVFNEIGCFDENLITSEDIDIGWRLYKKGFKAFYNPNCIIKHYCRNNLKDVLIQKFNFGRGFYRFTKKHPDYPTIAKNPPGIILSFLIEFICKYTPYFLFMISKKKFSNKRIISYFILVILQELTAIYGFIYESYPYKS